MLPENIKSLIDREFDLTIGKIYCGENEGNFVVQIEGKLENKYLTMEAIGFTIDEAIINLSNKI